MSHRPKLVRVVTKPKSFRYLLAGQLRFMANHFEIYAVSSPEPELAETEMAEGVVTLGIPMSRKITPLADLYALIAMIRLFLKLKPDIVHSHTPKAGIIAMLAAWMTRVPVRLHTVAGMPLTETSGIKHWLLTQIERLTYATATLVLPNSTELLRYIQAHHLCNPKKILLLGHGSSNGVDLNHFQRTPELENQAKILKQAHHLEDKFVLLFAGRLVKDKGIEELISACTPLFTPLPKIQLVIAGDFDEGLNRISDGTKTTIQTHPSITYLGFQKEIRPILAMADCVVLPSYREGLPQILLQACAMEVPCITTDIGGCNEVILHQQNGLIIPPKNAKALQEAIQDLCTHPTLLAQLKAQARPLVAERYNQTNLWTTLKTTYLQQLAPPFTFWKGRVALYAFLKALEIGPGDEVILPAYTCVVVPNAILYTGATPVYVDINPQTYCCDATAIKAAISPKTKLIICQNTYGLSWEVDQIAQLGRDLGIPTLEDCTHGFSGTYHGQANGSFCDAAFFSSQWNKPFSTGIGGYLQINNPLWIDPVNRVCQQLLTPKPMAVFSLWLQITLKKLILTDTTYWFLRDCYRFLSKHHLITGSSQGTELTSTQMPQNYFMGMSSFQKKLSQKALSALPDQNRRRKANGLRYHSWLSEHGKITLPTPCLDDHLCLFYPIRVANRTRFFALAQEHRIPIGDWFTSPLHPVSHLADYGFDSEQFPNAVQAAQNTCTLPTDITNIEPVLRFLNQYSQEIV
ncbi:MAG: DegT/DnrJ/EryC1/StrS family aminotransferase [Candidatus Margulisiibacteriota bacterium]